MGGRRSTSRRCEAPHRSRCRCQSSIGGRSAWPWTCACKAGDPRKQQARGAVQADAAAGGQGQAAAAQTQFDREGPADGGQLTALVYAARTDDLESVKILLAAGADVNQTTGYGWSPLLVATQNRHYKLAAYLLDHGANPDLANNGGWTPLYLATDNRNIENGDYPVRKADMDHLDFIKLLLDKGVDVNNRVKDGPETRTVFTNQWLDESGATAFLRASQSGDLVLMKAAPRARCRSKNSY